MKRCQSGRATIVAALLLVSWSLRAVAAEPLKFADIAGWWVAEPTYAGESSRVGLHFLEEDGKQSVRLSLLAIGGYEVPIGTVALVGNTLDLHPTPFPLTYDAIQGTLKGTLPEAAVPVYRIPVEFHRSEPLPKPALPAWNQVKPKVKWSLDLGSAVWAGLERDAATGRLYVGGDDGVLHAIDRDGSIAWTFRTGKAIKARPAVIGDAVYVASDSGYLFKLDKLKGTQRWRAKIDAGSPERVPTTEEKSRWDRYGSSVVADDAQLYVASRDKNLYALDIATGKQRWLVATNDMMTATPVRYRDLLLFASFDGKVQAVTARDGKPRWTYDARLPVAGDLVVADDRVFIGSRSYDLIALNAADGSELWKHYYWFSWIEAPPVVRDQVVYTGSSDAIGVFAINVKDGGLRWKTTVPGWAWARTAIDDNTVVAGTVGYGTFPGVRSGSLVAMDRSSGAIRWLHVNPPSQDVLDKKQEWGFAAGPLIADGIVYAADLTGRIYAFEKG
ncbi:MAG TPA: PQQ-binding-like beta-propeller repeat protein [Steroidobacteraceae bacterium]|jgi:outer membrane protein assembly factor BamB